MVDTNRYITNNQSIISKKETDNGHENFLLQIVDDEDKEESKEHLIEKALEQAKKTKSKEDALKYTHHIFEFSKNIDFTEGVIESSISLGNLYWNKSEFQTALEYLEVALKSNRTLQNQEYQGEIYKVLGNTYLRIGFVDKALDYYFKSLDIYEALNDQDKYGSICNNIGVAHKDRGEYEQALTYYLKSLDIKKDSSDANAVANVYVNIGILYYHQEEYDKSLKYLEKILGINSNELTDVVLSNIHNNIGQVCVELKDYKKALEHIHIALAINLEAGNKNGVAHSHQEIGRIMQLKGQHDTAMKSYKKALEISREINSLSNEASCLYLLGGLCHKMKDYDTAEQYLLKSCEMNEELNIKPALMGVCQLLADVYHDTDRFLESCVYMKRMLKLQEELSNEEKSKLLAEMQARFELQQRDSMIENLNVKQELLLKANQELELFAGKAAHDLKEPLRMMSSFSSLLVRKYGNQLDDTAQEFVNHIHEGAKRMEKLLTDMLTFAKSGANPEDSIDVNLNDILYVVESNLKLKITESQANITYNDLPVVRAANVAMIQLFQNIIANALKFKKSDVIPHIQIEATSHSDNFYQISIKDNGIGISKQQQHKVFIIFQRLHAREAYEGSGIGLATCKKIVECLGGKIWLESEEGKGTTFFFLLPKSENSLQNKSVSE